MILYILKSVSCALFFLILYRYLMEKDKMLKFKRFFLLVALVFSLGIPFIGMPQLVNIFPTVDEFAATYVDIADVQLSPLVLSASDNEATFADSQRQSTERPIAWIYIIGGIYLLVTAILLTRFIRNLVKLIKMARLPLGIKHGKAKLIVTNKINASFSFFNTIFLCEDDYKNDNVRNEILIHELTHVRQMHSADVLFVELLIVFFWFNPALYLYRRAMKLNHEFLADEEVINSTGNIPVYQMILIDRAAHPCNFSFVSNLTYLITKKRLIMMTKTTSKRSFLFKLIVLIPAFLLAGGVFSAKTMAENNVNAAIETLLAEQVVSSSEDEMIVPESGVSQEKLDEYSAIVSKYFGEAVDGKILWKSRDITEEDRANLYVIYLQMTKEQRGKQILKWMGPLNPNKLRSPNNDEWRSCTNSKNSEIWLDGKLIDSKTASAQNRKDIVFFLKDWKTEAEKSYMWTKRGHEEYMQQYGKQISRSDLLSIPYVCGFSISYNKDRDIVKNGKRERIE